MYRLISIKFSHYNEKARWALEHFGQPYRESAYMPLLHMPAVAWATRHDSDATRDRVSTRLSTPVLVCPDGSRICDSSRILRYLDERHRRDAPSLYGPDESGEIETLLHDQLGPHTRRLAYFYLLDDAELMRALARDNVDLAQRLAFQMMFPLGRKWMKKRMAIDAKHAQRSRDKISQIFDQMSHRFADGRPYLCGESFSAADLSLACMAAPSLVVSKEEGFGAVMPALDSIAPEAALFARELRDTPAGRHAMKMFASER